MVDAGDLKSLASNGVRVRVPPRVLCGEIRWLFISTIETIMQIRDYIASYWMSSDGKSKDL